VAEDASKDTPAGQPPARRKVSVKIVDVTAGDKLVKVLVPKDFDDRVEAGSSADLSALLSAAKALVQAVRPAGSAPQAGMAATLGRSTAEVRALEDKAIGHIFHHACYALGGGCFAAGTKLLTRDRWRAVETIRPGDYVLSRDERDPVAEPEWKVVEETFRRTGCVLHLHAGGEVIRTTPEHPFYAESKGWTAAGPLKPGNRLHTLSGEWVTVEEVFDTGCWEPVYNLWVADHHTYFVGDDHWGFSVWAHNRYEVLFPDDGQLFPTNPPPQPPAGPHGRSRITPQPEG
jgi:hypothetical protein